MRKIVLKLKEFRDKAESTVFFRNILLYILVPLMGLLQWLIVQLCCQDLIGCLGTDFVYVLIEAALLLAVDVLVALCTGRWWIGFCVTSLFAFVYGVANHYVIQLHGTPLSLRDFGNIGVTGEVMKGYVLEPTGSVILQTVLAVLCAVGIYLLRRISLGQKPFEGRRVIARGTVLIACVLAIYFGLFSPNPAKPAQTRSWAWEDALKTYGCMSCLIENALSGGDVILEPEGYSPEKAHQIAEEQAAAPTEETVTPDVIFILNETYYDLSLAADLQTDVDPFAALNGRDDLIRGYATSAVVGGGTNCSEYELLTGNSLHLTPGITPFQSIDMQGADGLVSRLEALGYTSLCANSESRYNYYRDTGYPGLGFDEIYFAEDFTGQEYYGGRGYETDESLYRNLITWYGQMGDRPRFAYLLTIQNHGGYILSDGSFDTVHVLGDYGERTEEINEYLTCVSLSAQALNDLIEYFENGDRPVVLCMVGDHTTFFARELIGKEVSEEQTDLLLRSTPYVVWSNCGFDESLLPETVSMHALSACVLAGAGIELCAYDSFVTEMCRTVPVFLSGGDWYDAYGVRHSADGEEMPQVLSDYLCLLCNNLSGGDERLEGFFCRE